nr:hypothetical protein [Tanacetum cinerariifolium]
MWDEFDEVLSWWVYGGDMEVYDRRIGKVFIGCYSPSSLKKISSRDLAGCLQVLSNLHDLFGCFMDYFWSCKLRITNFSLANSLQVLSNLHDLFGCFMDYFWSYMHDKDEVSALALWNVHANCSKSVEQAKDSLSEIKKFNTLVVKFLEEQVIRKKSKENVNASQDPCVGSSQVDMIPQITIRDPEVEITTKEMKDKLFARQETISILSQQKEAQSKLYKTREDKEIDKVIELENKVKKAQRANPRMYDIGCYNDNLALMLAPESDEVIRLEKESRSKLSDLIRPFDYNKLNNLYDLFVPQREKSPEQRYFSERSRLSHTSVNNGNSKESFNKQTTVLEKRMDESIPLDKKCQSSIEIFKVKTYVNTIITGVELCKEKMLTEHILVTLIHSFKRRLKQIFLP